jgi:HK97 family phage portal protein
MLGWLQRRKPEQARIDPVIGNIAEGETVSSSDIRMFEIFGDPTTSSGAVVNATTAMRVSAVYACVGLICGAISQLARPIFQRQGEERERIDHDYWWILNEQFSPMWSAAAAWEYLVAQVLLRGDGIAYILRNRAGEMTGLMPFARSDVIIQKVKPDSPRLPHRLRYLFNTEVGAFGAEPEDVLHLPGLGFDGVCSMSVIQWGARNGIGIALQGDEHAGKFFSEGGKPEVAIKAPARMTPTQQDDFVAAWTRKYGGTTGNRRMPLILTEGLDVKELTMTAVDQQLLESRQWQVIDIARAFGVPPHMIGETTKSTSWGTGIEQQSIGFVKYTLAPHLKRFENEINRKLFRTARYFMEHDTDSLMAGDSKAQADYFTKAVGGPGAQGWMAVDEVRRKKNLKPMGGDFAKVIKAGQAAQGTQRKEDEEPEAAPAGAEQR